MPAGDGRRASTAARGEEAAVRHLRARGLEILDRNWRAGRRELDVVARDGDVVAFVEVKTRTPGPQAPLEAIGRRKRRDLRSAAESWIHSNPGVGREFRFDAVSVRLVPGAPPTVDHVEGAFFADDT